MREILYEPDEVWGGVTTTAGNYTLIAEDTFAGIEICAELDATSKYKTISIHVMCDGEVECEAEVSDAQECEERVSEIYAIYLPDITSDMEDSAEAHTEEIIHDREEELDQAVMDFLYVAVNDFYDFDADLIGEVVSDVKEHFLEYLSRKHNLNIYRPMFLEDIETGEEYYTETPYEDMVFEDNPIYKK